MRMLQHALLRRAERWYQHAITDVYVISYPKCGRTWLRLMLGRALAQHFRLDDVELLEIHRMAKMDRRIPMIRFTHDDAPHTKRPEDLERDKRQYERKRVVFVVRDPRDVVVSLYFQLNRRDCTFEGSLDEFLQCPVGSIATITTFYNIWSANIGTPREFLLVRYEDLHKDAVRELDRLVTFLRLPDIPYGVLAEAVRYASFSRMHQMEKSNASRSFRLTAGNPKDLESYKVRKGVVGGHTAYLTDEQVSTIDAWLSDNLSDFFNAYRQ